MASNNPVPDHQYRGAVCDDDIDGLDFIERHLRRALSEHGVPMRLDVYARAEQLFAAIQRGTHYDILFLDIDMPRWNGIELTRGLRDLGFQSHVVFISNKEELVFQTFEVQPLFFLRKSHFLETLPLLAQTIAREFRKSSKKVVSVEELHSSRVYSFDIQQLVYIEAIGKQCLFVTTTSKTRIQCRLSAIAERLEPHGFVQCHRSYVVNCRFIFALSRDSLTLDDRGTLPIGRSHQQAVRDAFTSFICGTGAE
ncbi:DNA-binding response regulator [Bifidobacterium lemurum]|uniref:DNA-binding response regulator n=1 Tax=Bifidobacterium lemurum TaxID=1603886 RepID=A0A261FRN9_9BIFI|nr:LytTR family DNA-binding domain-containing protein [Bifidobacterium lemurum]OZG61748.1 DNA-binding response regulator [Bifidobacterium lemurum]QOL34905.1 response regulator transcription factor [Bifidobacterium lemurum]